MTTLEDRHQAVLITLRQDGSPQSSNVAFALSDGVARVSVTADRAKTRNLERDPRCLLHVLGSTFWDPGGAFACQLQPLVLPQPSHT